MRKVSNTSPIGVANFEVEIVESLPDNLKSSLPTIEEIEAEATLYAQRAKLLEVTEESETETRTHSESGVTSEV